MKKCIIASIVIVFLSIVSVDSASAAQVSLRFSDWHLTEDVWNKSLNEAIAIFHKKYPNIKVTLEPVSYKEKETKYTVESAAGRAPDVFHVHAFSLPMFFSKGFAKDLTPFIEAEGPGFLDAWYPLPLKLMKHKGKMHAMPGDYMTMVLFYNTEMFKAAGLDPDKPPKTWDEFLDYAKRLTRDTDGDGKVDQWGFGTVGAKSPGFSLRFGPFIWSFGGDYLTPDMKHSALDSPEAKEAFTFFVELYSKHKVVPPGLTAMNPQEVRTQLAQKKVAMILGSGWTPPIVNKINPDLKAFEVLKCAPVPTKRKQATAIWLSSWVMSPNTKHPKEAWELMKFITSKEMELKWFKDNRVTSSRKDVSGVAPEILNDKFASVLASQLPYGEVEPQIKQWPEIMDTFTTSLQEAIVGMKTPEKAITEAHERINAILAR
ncbi:MAG: sugar ABC transporter substrate-binding protein [Deltaproteobacteria bacterium]|nr:sugar ABC transporter substrate-binding protein [Deltaproteobacteria bacterium]MBW1960884.1 sugar ABC transporter substrate-binding protein [Deltaproteobacteria bacterium]MBW2152559.1 sugar ABC transporter substrate-binding protein [Deltaproteobacteria bacterium]